MVRVFNIINYILEGKEKYALPGHPPMNEDQQRTFENYLEQCNPRIISVGKQVVVSARRQAEIDAGWL